MARTWREIPNSPYRDNDGRNPLNSAPLEEKKHPDYTKKVRDKDNEGSHKGPPKDWRNDHQGRYRSNVKDELRKMEQVLWRNPTHHINLTTVLISIDDLEITIPDPKEFQPYYW